MPVAPAARHRIGREAGVTPGRWRSLSDGHCPPDAVQTSLDHQTLAEAAFDALHDRQTDTRRYVEAWTSADPLAAALVREYTRRLRRLAQTAEPPAAQCARLLYSTAPNPAARLRSDPARA